MELNEFLEAREDLEFLDRDYIDVVTDRNDYSFGKIKHAYFVLRSF